MTYKEHIYKVCENTAWDDREDAIETCQYLVRDLIRFNTSNCRMDDKLKELMSAKDYQEWVAEEAKKLFKEEIDMMEDSDFKTFCEENFDIVTDETLSMDEAIRKIGEKDA